MDNITECLQLYQDEDVAELYFNLSQFNFQSGNPCDKYLSEAGKLVDALKYASFGVILINIVVNIPFLYFSLMKITTSCLKHGRKGVNPVLYFLALISFNEVVGWIPAAFAISLDWSRSDEYDRYVCSSLWKIGGFNYVAASLCSYNILFLRAKVVLNSRIFDSHTYIHALSKFSLLSTWTGVPAFMGVVVYFFGGGIWITGLCGMVFPAWVTAAFLVADSLISVLFLITFLYPVYWTIRISKKAEASNLNDANHGHRQKVMRIAKKNLLLSTIAIVIVLTALTLGTIGTAVTGGYPTLENANDQYWSGVFMLATTTDRCLISIVHYMITSAWWPDWLHRRFGEKDHTTNVTGGTGQMNANELATPNHTAGEESSFRSSSVPMYHGNDKMNLSKK